MESHSAAVLDLRKRMDFRRARVHTLQIVPDCWRQVAEKHFVMTHFERDLLVEVVGFELLEADEPLTGTSGERIRGSSSKSTSANKNYQSIDRSTG